MQSRRPCLLSLVFVGWLVAVAPGWAAGTVQLELVGDTQTSALAFQEWAQLLGKAGIPNVRIRAGSETDKPGIETQGDADHPTYVVTGIVRSADELILPGGRFRRGEVRLLAEWLHQLAERGPDAGKRARVPFGLAVADWKKVCDDLAAPVGFATRGVDRQQVVERIAQRLKLPLKVDRQIAQSLADDKVTDELTDLSCGTALAYMLRTAGYGFVPHVAGGEVVYVVVKPRSDPEVWPVGWPSEQTPQQQLPALFEFLNVNIQNVSAAMAVEAIAGRVKTLALFDHDALARHHIDPAKTLVSLPRVRTTYSIALRKLLFQAGMKFEVRCDEAGAPLLWITALKPG
jgi:hypothetical protein